MTCPPAGRFFLLAFSFVRFFPAICPPICPPPAPLPLLWCSEEVPPPQREGDLLFFQKGGDVAIAPLLHPPEGLSCPAGLCANFGGAGARPAPFPAICPPPCPLPLLWCAEVVPSPQREGDFLFFQKGEWPSPPFASPRGTFLPGGAMRKFWRDGTLFFHFPCLGMRKARKQMLPGFCVTPNSRSSSSPSAGSCGRCAPPWGRCPGSTAPGRPCRR